MKTSVIVVEEEKFRRTSTFDSKVHILFMIFPCRGRRRLDYESNALLQVVDCTPFILTCINICITTFIVVWHKTCRMSKLRAKLIETKTNMIFHIFLATGVSNLTHSIASPETHKKP